MLKKSKYIICFKEYIYNSLTGSLIKLSPNYIASILNDDFSSFNDEQINALYKNGFLVDDDINETNRVLKKIESYYKNHLNITFFTTMNCNFSCLYCYENKNKKVIDRSTYDLVLSEIQKLNDLKSIRISWFGGEPSLCFKDIVYFMGKLIKYAVKNNIKVYSDMTTNFYLINKEMLEELVDLHIDYFQVTIDGASETHNHYRPLLNGKDSYSKICMNINEAHKSSLKFHINIRTNFDSNSDYSKFYKEMSYLKSDDRFSFSVHAIENWGKNHYGCEDILKEERRKELIGCIKENGLNLANNTLFDKLGPCYANLKNHISINPDGEVLKCTVMLENKENMFGTFKNFDVNDNYFDTLKYDECLDCKVFPICLARKCKYKKYESFKECERDSVNKLTEVLYEKNQVI